MIETVSQPALQGDALAEVVALVREAREATGRRPIGDQQWLELTRAGERPADVVLALDHGQLLGHAQISHGNGTWTVGIATRRPDDHELTDLLVSAALARIGRVGGGEVHWWVLDDGHGPAVLDAATDIARRHGLHGSRALHQMRVPLPLEDDGRDRPTVRSFVVGVDESAWLVANNAAFATHPEQGGWSLATLQMREAEPWFDPSGFLLHERDGRIAGFCWTKIHVDESPVLGEIYAIAVHPDFHGLGLGRAMTAAGLDSIAHRGIATGMLYVDHDNTAAYDLYRRLGFVTHHTDRAFIGIVPAGGDDPLAGAHS